jgi:hypothetical protein
MRLDPLVSVVLPVRNGERYVDTAIKSILSQTYEDIELLVLDDGSTDRTSAILAALTTEDPRLHVIRNGARGLVYTLNYGVAVARGDYVARMDADDIALPQRIEAQVAALDEDPRLGLVGAAVRVIAEDDPRPLYTVHYPTTDKELRTALPFGSPFAHPVVMMRKSAYARAGGYRPQFAHAEDYDLWLRMAEVARLRNLAEPLLHYRTHAKQVSLVHAQQQVISVVGAQVASRLRQAGEAEPFCDDRPVALHDLECVPRYSAFLLADSLVAAATVSAMQMHLMRQHEQAEALLDWALSVAPSVRLSRRTTARMRLTRAACYWSAGQRRRGASEGLLGCVADPLTVARLASKAMRSWVPSVVRS